MILKNWEILKNASSIIATTGVTSLFGFAYWWFGARQFPPEAVGIASAAVSAMLLLGNISLLGFGTLLIGELPKNPDRKGPLIATALVMVTAAGMLLGLLFVALSPWLSADLNSFRQNLGTTLLFAAGVSLTAVSLVLDQAVIGLMRGEVQLWRNGSFAVVKLIAIIAAGCWLRQRAETVIFSTWVFGLVISLALLWITFLHRGGITHHLRPDWSLLRKIGSDAFWHHILNLTLQAPGLALPIIVVALLSARMNASFYAAWMIATLAFAGSQALATVLYAVSAADLSILSQKLRVTLKLSLLYAMLASATLVLSANFILGLFGPSYTQQAAWCLRILALAVFPLTFKHHFIALCRVRGWMAGVFKYILIGSILELVLASLGAKSGGLSGLSFGWLAAVCLEAVLMGPAVIGPMGFPGIQKRRYPELNPPEPACHRSPTSSPGPSRH